MTLSPSAVVELARLAFLNARLGRHKASDAYHRHALGQGWHNSPAWIEGRPLYANAWMRHRAAYRAASARSHGIGEQAEHAA